MIIFVGLHTWITQTAEDNAPRRMTGLQAHGVVSKHIPEDFLDRGHFNWFRYDGSVMTLVFDILSLITIDELGWQEAPGVEIENTGALPPGTFIELSFKINGYTGEILSMKASDTKITTPWPSPPMAVYSYRMIDDKAGINGVRGAT